MLQHSLFLIIVVGTLVVQVRLPAAAPRASWVRTESAA
jgi:hypothetical protein